MNTFKIFTPEKKAYINKGMILSIIFFGCMIPFLFERDVLGKNGLSGFSIVLASFSFVGVVCVGLYFVINGYNNKKPLRGTISGDISFKDSEILINDKTYPIDDLRKISFVSFNDYLGKRDTSRYAIDKISNGVDNAVELYFSNGKKVTYHFQMTERYQLRDIREQLIAYHKAGKLHFLNLIDVLGIEDYNAIQNFRNTLSIKSY